MKANQKQLPRESDLDRLNALIDWYRMNRPGEGRTIQVRMTVKELRRFAHPIDLEAEAPRRWHYRGVTLDRLNPIEGPE